MKSDCRMTIKIRIVFVSLFLIITFCCFASEPDNQAISDNGFNAGDISWDKVTPMEFINILKVKKQGFVTVGQAPKSWIKYEDVKQLMELIDSQEPVVPVVAIISSYLPGPGRMSTLGNEAMFLIEGYRNDRYPCGICSIYGFKGNPADYRKWWKSLKHEKGI